MINSADVIARHTRKYNFSESDLETFLKQAAPRELPESLRHRGQNSKAVLVAMLCGVGGSTCVGLLLAPRLLPQLLGQWTAFLTGAGLLFGAAVATGVVLAILRPSSNLHALLRNGALAVGRFSAIDAPHPGHLRSAASHASLNDLDYHGTVKLEFEVDGQTIRVQRTLPFQYLPLAASYRDTDREVLILYSKDDPSYARWVGEFLFPCPEPPSPEIQPGIDE